jgi:hypothetical protein
MWAQLPVISERNQRDSAHNQSQDLQHRQLCSADRPPRGCSGRECCSLDQQVEEFPMNERVRGPAAPSSARRRLLKGSFATPAIMTLCSGSALAASSALNRIANLPNGADPVLVKDSICRIAEYETKLNGSTLKVFKGKDVADAAASLSGLAKQVPDAVSATGFDSQLWYLVDSGTVTKVGEGNGVAPVLTNRLLALRLQYNGNPNAPSFTIVGVADSSSESSPGQIMTMSAWGSVF